MRDDRHKWDFVSDDAFPLTESKVTVSVAQIKRQTLVSGRNILQHYPDATGWPDVVTDNQYAVAIRRDRVLLVDSVDALKDGWHDDSEQAISDATDAYSVYDITGLNALELLKRGGDVSLAVPSGSVARLLFGMGAFLYPHRDAHSFRLHVGRPQNQAMLSSLVSCAQKIE